MRLTTEVRRLGAERDPRLPLCALATRAGFAPRLRLSAVLCSLERSLDDEVYERAYDVHCGRAGVVAGVGVSVAATAGAKPFSQSRGAAGEGAARSARRFLAATSPAAAGGADAGDCATGRRCAVL